MVVCEACISPKVNVEVPENRRQFLFRVWDGKRFLYDAPITSGGLIMAVNQEENALEIGVAFENVTLERCTGKLADCSYRGSGILDRLIYEGDIVILRRGIPFTANRLIDEMATDTVNEEVWAVRFNDFAWQIIDPLDENVVSDLCEIVNNSDWEIIGNIHEDDVENMAAFVIEGKQPNIHEEVRDLLAVPQGYYLAYSISGDFLLAAGVAKQIDLAYNMADKLAMIYGEIDEEAGGRPDSYTGKALVVDNVFNLVTKDVSGQQPRLETIRACLLYMKREMARRGIRKVAMPRIGCGLDRCDWTAVKNCIAEVFKYSDVEILICVR